MKNKILIPPNLVLIFSFVFITIGLAQAPDVLWTKRFGGDNWDYGNSVVQAEDGGFYIVGFKDFIPGQLTTGDVWLIRTDSNGDTLWSKTYGDSSSRDEGKHIQPVSVGGYIIAAETTPFVTGKTDAYIIRINDDGDTLWTKTYGGESSDYLARIHQTKDNGFILVGGTYSFGLGGLDVWLIRTDENGDTLWTRTYGTTATDYGNSVQETSDGGFIITGRTMDFTNGSPALYMVHADSNGDVLWTKTYNHPNAPVIFSIGTDVYEMPDGGFLVGGSNAVLLIRTDANGDTLWTKLYNGECTTLQPTSDGGFVVAGYTLMIRMNADADTLWTKYVGEFLDYAYSVQQTSDGGFIVTGRSNVSGSPDVWITRIGQDGTTSAGNNSSPLFGYKLSQNYPNPFNPTTKINWQSPVSSHQTLKIYDVLGNEIAELVDEFREAGSYEINFDASLLSSGVYFYRLNAGSFVDTKKMILVR